MLRPSNLDYVAFYEKPLLKFERLLETHLAFAPHGFQSFRRSAASWAQQKLRLPDFIYGGELLQGFHGRLCYVGHHESHAASAFFPSPFTEAARSISFCVMKLSAFRGGPSKSS